MPSYAGQLALILHAHLPFVRHPEHERFYEEQWLFEAVAETYLPLLDLMRGWSRDGLDWRLTLTLTPTLCAMLEDPLLRGRTRRYLAERLELAESECDRWHLIPGARAAVGFARERFQLLLQVWDSLGGQLIPEFRKFLNSGHLEILCCSATHAFLPFLAADPVSLSAQVELGVSEHVRHFGCRPSGIWLPECAYTKDLEPVLVRCGLKWFPVESHAFRHGTPLPSAATFKPVILRSGLAAFPRDAASARQVWSRNGGYPGDPRYREFHRDISDDCEWHYIGRYLPGTENRVSTGLKLHRVTGATAEKEWYDRGVAVIAAREHGRHFVSQRLAMCVETRRWLGESPLITAPYDAELFGHWWFEGPEFLDQVVRELCASDAPIRLTTPAHYLATAPALEHCQIAASTWGEEGYASVWLDPKNAWIPPQLRRIESRLRASVERFLAMPPNNPMASVRCLNQAAREMLLAQASDWPFLLRMGTAGDYPAHRVTGHLAAAERLLDLAEPAAVADPGFVASREKQFNLFPELDALSLYRRRL